jgi:hypothetical protein
MLLLHVFVNAPDIIAAILVGQPVVCVVPESIFIRIENVIPVPHVPIQILWLASSASDNT